MKNFNLNSTENDQSIKDTSFKEVVIIGNGPSGITLSYFLAGNWPYWMTEEISKHPDELLRARLTFADQDVSLIEHDLHELAQGLEGRTTNPVSLLFDNLQHPGADLGLKLPCMLKFKYHKDKEIDHVVLGKGEPGGSWNRMEPNLRTLSLSTWMSLPNLNYDDWVAARNVDDVDSCQCNQNNNKRDEKANENAHLNSSSHNLSNLTTSRNRKKQCIHESTISDEVKTRALVHHVAEYYADYVHLMKLDKFFRNDTVVLNIRQIKENEKFKFSNEARWIVHGYDKMNKKPFSIACNKVVLANGGSDIPNHLGVKGESKSVPWLKYELPLLENAIENEKLNAVKISNVKPILIVGAGLSAADAIIACRNAGVEVIHVYRGMAAGFMGLPEAFFPEYNLVYRMMRNPREKYDLYQAIPESTLKEIKTVNGCHYVTVLKNNNEELTFEVSYCAILIGSRPNLSFISNLPKNSNFNDSCNNLNSNNNNKLTNVSNNYNENGSDNFAIRSLKRLKFLCEKCRHLNICFGNRTRNQMLNSLIEDNNVVQRNCLQQKNCECEHIATLVAERKQHCKVDESGFGFGDNPKKPIDCKNNPIAVNKFSNELLNVPAGVFALGPLVGDNFVRFIAGGALSISSFIFSERR